MKEYEIAPFDWGVETNERDRLTGWIFEQSYKTKGIDTKDINGSRAARSSDGKVLVVTYQFTDGQQLIVTQTKSEEGDRRTVNCEPEMAEKLKLLGIIPSV